RDAPGFGDCGPFAARLILTSVAASGVGGPRGPVCSCRVAAVSGVFCMRGSRRVGAGRVLAVAVSLAGVVFAALRDVAAQTARREWPPVSEPDHRSHMVIPANTRFPITRKITIGADKSMLIEVPVDLQNVLVSNPDVVDAVVQSSRQVYLLAKDVGDA